MTSFVYKNNPLAEGTYSVSSGFGPRPPVKTPKGYSSTQHNGIDLSTSGKSIPIYAVADGKVSKIAYDDDGYGHYIVIEHENGVETFYAHMAQKSSYKVGDTISAGDHIGNVGTTGQSSGYHLHFEIRVNGKPIDPAPFIEGGVTVVSPSYDASQNVIDNANSTGSSYGTVSAGGGSVIGQRVADVTPQPIHAFVNIYVGRDQLLLSTEPPKPQILQSFEYERLEGSGENARFVLFDDNWEVLEEVLAANHDHIYIEYGYYGTGKKSPRYKHLLQNYNVSFHSTGTILTVESITEGVVQNLKSQSMELNTLNPTEAVKKICEALGYVVLPENFDASKDIVVDPDDLSPGLDYSFNIVEGNPITYIKDEIIPQASHDNEELFSFDLKYDYETDRTIAYFKRQGYDDALKEDKVRTYIYQKGYDSSVIDFTVDIKGVFGGNGTFEVATEYRSSVFDTNHKNEDSYSASKSTVATVTTGNRTQTNTDQSNPVIDSAAYSPVQMKSRLYYNMKSSFYDSYTATLTVVGDPTLEIHDFVRIINVTDRGYLHHTSGIYWIEGIIDSIQDGSMVTTLKLVKNATQGDIDGIEIINPKKFAVT